MSPTICPGSVETEVSKWIMNPFYDLGWVPLLPNPSICTLFAPHQKATPPSIPKRDKFILFVCSPVWRQFLSPKTIIHVSTTSRPIAPPTTNLLIGPMYTTKCTPVAPTTSPTYNHYPKLCVKHSLYIGAHQPTAPINQPPPHSPFSFIVYFGEITLYFGGFAVNLYFWGNWTSV